MNSLPLQFLILTIAGWVNRGQQDAIEYLREENRSPYSAKTPFELTDALGRVLKRSIERERVGGGVPL